MRGAAQSQDEQGPPGRQRPGVGPSVSRWRRLRDTLWWPVGPCSFLTDHWRVKDAVLCLDRLPLCSANYQWSWRHSACGCQSICPAQARPLRPSSMALARAASEGSLWPSSMVLARAASEGSLRPSSMAFARAALEGGCQRWHREFPSTELHGVGQSG